MKTAVYELSIDIEELRNPDIMKDIIKWTIIEKLEQAKFDFGFNYIKIIEKEATDESNT